jgi:mannan endo-1,4-beta-mannosidase
MKLHNRSFLRSSLLVLSVMLVLLASCSWLMNKGSVYWDIVIKSLLTRTKDNAFILRSGSSLMLDGQPFRFSGANIYWLGLQESNSNYPSHFRVDDALATASFMGATVVRSHTLGISVGCHSCVEPSLGRFNQVALQHIDYAIQSARKHHIRLIIPLVDNWHYYHGGKHTFTDWRGISDEGQFYSNPQVINDFKQYIHTLLNHKNSYNGIAYKDDPTIMAWETGNELYAPFNWIKTITAYLKRIDQKHLVMDGNSEDSDNLTNFLPDLSIKTIDIYTGHYYPPNITALHTEINQAIRAHKVFIVGEYDWNTDQGDTLSGFLSSIEQSGAAGDLYWSLFPHDDQYGFVRHNEHYTLHYPGDTPDMRWRVIILSAHAYSMRDLPMPTATPPGTAVITGVSGHAITWRGAFGIDMYTVERSTRGAHGPWTVICDLCATDDYTPWIDMSRPSSSAWYRVRGATVSGVSGPYSKVYGSVQA